MSLTRLLLRLWLGRRLPTASGELRVRGPHAPVTVRRDGYGVPHIDAESEFDACFAIGFCQGQDRAAQLEVLWRIGRGRMAEWVGPAGLGVDRVSRRIGFRRAAEKQLPVLADHSRGQLAAFAAGVSAGNSAGLAKPPHEFALLGGTPSAWDAADVLTVLKLQSFALASNWDVELARLRVLLADGPEALLAVDPVAGAGGRGTGGESLASDLTPLPLPPSPTLADRLSADLAALRTYLPTGGGSNNWVIAGSRTASGKPLLACDPHLAPSAPPPWYLAHARCPEWEAAGAGLAGTPGFPIGHNGFAAWGVTAGLTDNSDFFLETLSPDGRGTREADGTFAPGEVVREVIRVKGRPDVTEEVLITPRGPVVSPLAPDLLSCRAEHDGALPIALSLRAVWLDPLPVSGFLGMLGARSFGEFRRPFERWPLLPLNVVYADANGGTGYQLIGQLPERAGGHGLVPRPADLADSGWTGLVPFDQMPHAADFPAGYFATANNDPSSPASGGLTPPESAPWLGADYCDPYRVRVIFAALAARDSGWTVEDCLSLQRDVRCIPWEEMRDVVLALTPTDPDARDALALLRDWDGRVDSESPPACVYELFVAGLSVRVVRAKAPKGWRAGLGETALGPDGQNLFAHRRLAHLVRLLREQPAEWFASWASEMEAVLGEVVRRLRREVGPGPAFNLGPVPCGGDSTTPSQASVRPADPTAFTHNVANLRAVFDLADLSKSRFVLCGGQSGNPCSGHHADQLPLWQAGEAVAMPWFQADVIRAAKSTLRLLPA